MRRYRQLGLAAEIGADLSTRDGRAAYRREWRARERERLAEWRAANPELARERDRDARDARLAGRMTPAERRARRRWREVRAFVEPVELAELVARAGGRCGICGELELAGDPWQIDHIQPISRGGVTSYANTQLAHGSCNRRKGARLPLTLF